jgi:hypothetical protein
MVSGVLGRSQLGKHEVVMQLPRADGEGCATPLTPALPCPPFQPTLDRNVRRWAPVVVPMDSAERWHRSVLGWAHPLSADNSERVGADTKFLFDRRDPQNVIKIQAGDWLASGTGYYICARAPA